MHEVSKIYVKTTKNWHNLKNWVKSACGHKGKPSISRPLLIFDKKKSYLKELYRAKKDCWMSEFTMKFLWYVT